MIKFTMDGKELKTMIEKAMATIDKNAVFSNLTTVYFQIDQEKNLRIWGTNLKHYAEVFTDHTYNTSPGVVGVSVDDIKIITKMNGMVEFKELEKTENQHVATVKNGRKIITIPVHENLDIFLPILDKTEMEILDVPQSWMYETIDNLSVFSDYSSNQNTALHTLNFNLKERKVEALDGYRISERRIEEKYVTADMKKLPSTMNRSVMLHNMCVPVLRKLLDKKSGSETKFFVDKKYIKISGKDFNYVVKQVDGEFFKTEGIWHDYKDIHFTVDRDEMINVMKYDRELNKMDPEVYGNINPVCLTVINEKLYAYIKTKKYESMDTLDADDMTWEDGFYICFDPEYILDALQVVDSNVPVFRDCANKKNPIVIEGNEYRFLILPVFNSTMDQNIRDFKNKVA